MTTPHEPAPSESTPPVAAPRSSPLAALTILGGSSAVTVVAGIASQKVAAVMLGDDGVGALALALSLQAMTTLVVGLGVGAALVAHLGRIDLTSDLPAAAAAIRSAQSVIVGVLGLMAIAAVVAAPFVSDLLLGPSSRPLDLLIVVISSGFSAMTVLEQSVLASFGRVRAIAIAAVATCFVSPVVNGLCFAAAGRRGIIAGLFLGTLLVFVITWFVRRATLPVLRKIRVHGRDRWKDSVRLSRFGVKVLTTNLLGALITIATVVLINEQLGEATVGHYRSVLVIAEGYTVAVSLAVQQDLFPRLTRAASDPEEFSRQVVEQIRLFITLYVPLALALMVLAVPVLTILFSGEFTPAQSFLRWRLAGDLFRIVGSVLTTSLLARALLGRRLVAEVGGSLLWFAGTLIGVTAFGFAGIGPFFVASTVGYVLILDRLTAGSLTRLHARRLREVVLVAGLALLIPCVLQEIASPRVAVVASACLLVPVGAYSLRSLQRIRHGASGLRPAQSA